MRKKMKMNHVSTYTASHWLNGSPSLPGIAQEIYVTG